MAMATWQYPVTRSVNRNSTLRLLDFGQRGRYFRNYPAPIPEVPLSEYPH